MYKLEVQDLHKRYGSHEVLKGVSLAAKAGDVISIIGSSGSGKSTFLRCINLLEQPHAGKILLNNEELKLVAGKDGALKAADSRQLQRMRSRLSMVFQHFNLWSHMTALENVIEAPVHVLGVSKKEALEKAEHYLAKVGVAHRKDAFPGHIACASTTRSELVIPVYASGGRLIGVLDIDSDQPDAFTEAESEALQAILAETFGHL